MDEVLAESRPGIDRSVLFDGLLLRSREPVCEPCLVFTKCVLGERGGGELSQTGRAKCCSVYASSHQGRAATAEWETYTGTTPWCEHV